jgi:RNA polymerase sigma-70 factor (ECF subfamily)
MLESTRRQAFIRLIEEYGPALRRLAAAYFDRASDREDLFQEIAVALWKAIPGFRGDSSERTWLYRIAHNTAITAAVKGRRHGRHEDPISTTLDPPSPAPDAEQAFLIEEKRRRLLDSIRSLPTLDRQIIILHLDGLSYAEIEEISGLSVNAVGIRLTRIREKLKTMISSEGVVANGR